MSLFSPTFEDGARTGSDAPENAKTGRPVRPRGGPVLMGDIQPAPGGRPLLLLLWEHWQDAGDRS